MGISQFFSLCKFLQAKLDFSFRICGIMNVVKMNMNSLLSMESEYIFIKSHKSELAPPFHPLQSISDKITYSDTNLVAYSYYVQAAIKFFSKG